MEGFKECIDCNSELVDELVAEAENCEDEDHAEYLTTVVGSIEADMLESLLKANRIPVLRKDRETGGYMTIYMGLSNFGVDMYVPSKLLDKAKELIESNTDEALMEEIVMEDSEEAAYVDGATDKKEIDVASADSSCEAEQKYKKRQRIGSWILFILFVPGLAFFIVYELFRLIKYLFN